MTDPRNWTEGDLIAYLRRFPKERDTTAADPRKISEKVFQGEVRKMALIHGWKYYHTFNSMRSTEGFPDTIMLRGDRMIVDENKSETGKVTGDQDEWLDAFKLVRKVEVYLWRPSDIDKIWQILSK